MKLRRQSKKYTYSLYLGFIAFSLNSLSAHAVTYNYPTAGGGTLAVAPQALANGDTLNINSGTFQTTSATNYTVNSSAATATGTTINVLAGATLGYAGTNTGGAAIFSSRADAGVTTSTIAITGNLSIDAGLYAIYLNNSNATVNDTYNITLNSGSYVSGAILSSGVKNVSLTMSGTANVVGNINMNVNGTLGTSNSVLTLNSSANYTANSQLANIGLITLTGNSTLTINAFNTNVNALTIANGSTVNLNYALLGVSASDGAITNNGTFNIAANISKTGTFTGTGTNVVTQNVDIATSSCAVTHTTMVLSDILNYGAINLTTGGVGFSSSSNFDVTYEGGYFPGGTYTLVDGNAAPTLGTLSYPASTLFLTFAQPTIAGNNVTMLVTRTPFTNYATNSLTEAIATNLESLGADNPNSSMVAVLNGVEASTTGGATENALEQLAPLISAPVYGFQVQSQSLAQVQLRLAELRSGITSYYAGDIGKDNHLWIRGLGGYANQLAKDDTFGYYARTGGAAIGFDRNLDTKYTVGAAFVYANSHITDKVNQVSNTQLKSYIGIGYGTYNYDDITYLDWMLGVTANNFDSTRYINLNNVYIGTATASYSSQQVAASILWGKNYSLFDFLQANPEGSVLYTFAKQYLYDEMGAEGANLAIQRPNSDILQLGLGCKLSTPILLNPGIMIPEIHGTAFYYPITGKQNNIFNFVAGGGPMTSIFNMSRTGLRVGGALTVAVQDRLEVKFNFDYDIQDRYTGYSVYLDLRYTL